MIPPDRALRSPVTAPGLELSLEYDVQQDHHLLNIIQIREESPSGGIVLAIRHHTTLNAMWRAVNVWIPHSTGG
jgi:hypothetical protein